MKLLIALAMVVSTIPIATPAAAMTADEREQAYESCRSEYVRRGMGNDDAANAYCYNKYYNEDQYSPPANTPCAWNACNDTWIIPRN